MRQLSDRPEPGMALLPRREPVERLVDEDVPIAGGSERILQPLEFLV